VRDFIIHKTESGWQNTSKWKQHLDQLPVGKYSVTIKSANKRSLPQNAYYWGVVVPMVYEGLREAGFDQVRNTEDAHEVMKSLFLKVREERAGMVIERVMSTTELKTIEFNEYLLNISVWAFDYLGISIPEPSTQLTAF
jgi:RNA-binding protein YhbY